MSYAAVRAVVPGVAASAGAGAAPGVVPSAGAKAECEAVTAETRWHFMEKLRWMLRADRGPCNGYLYKILKAQGANAAGGARK
jgi:hypothetical protein